MQRFQAGDFAVWHKMHGNSRFSRIVCKVTRTNPLSYRVEYTDPVKGTKVTTAGLYQLFPFRGDWDVEKKNLNLVRYGSLRIRENQALRHYGEPSKT